MALVLENPSRIAPRIALPLSSCNPHAEPVINRKGPSIIERVGSWMGITWGAC